MIKIARIIHYRQRLIIAGIILLALGGVIKWTTSIAFAADKTAAVGEKIITIHDAGEERGVVTTAGTLREVLAQVGIRLDKNDITEPGLDVPLVASSYEANIYRARPVLIKDGGKRTTVITAYRTGKQVAKQAGLQLNEQDIATLQLSKDIATDGPVEVLTIDYATPVTLVFYGQTIHTATRAKTVGALLKEKAITAATDDTIMPAAGTAIAPHMTVQLWKNGIQTATQEEDIAFTTRQVQDANRDKGYKEVQAAGVNGKKTVTYEITMQNGKEVARKVVNSVVTTRPVEQVEVIGTKVNLPAGSHTDWMAAAGIAESDYGYVDYIIAKESGWNFQATNRSSGAYGLCQALPANKMASAGGDYTTNPVTQLKWCNGYAVSRYGGWAGAYNAWLVKHWW